MNVVAPLLDGWQQASPAPRLWHHLWPPASAFPPPSLPWSPSLIPSPHPLAGSACTPGSLHLGPTGGKGPLRQGTLTTSVHPAWLDQGPGQGWTLVGAVCNRAEKEAAAEEAGVAGGGAAAWGGGD